MSGAQVQRARRNPDGTSWNRLIEDNPEWSFFRLCVEWTLAHLIGPLLLVLFVIAVVFMLSTLQQDESGNPGEQGRVDTGMVR